MTVSTATAVTTATGVPAGKLNRWDSPWLNPKFLIGFSMVAAVALLGVIGPLFWNTDLARVATSPQNLPPPWSSGAKALTEEIRQRQVVADRVAADATAPAAVPTQRSSLTGGNPLQQSAAAAPTQASTSMTGGNPLAANNNNATGSTSVTGGNPLQSQSSQGATASGNQSTSAAVRQSQGRSGPITNALGFGAPTWDHPFGTESNGRDMLAVVIVGAPRSLRVGLIAAGLGIAVGILLGFTAGFMGGWVDNVIRTISDAVITIPSLAVLIVISAYVRQVSVENMAFLLALFAWSGPTRLIRAQVLTMRERGYVQMARLSGASTFDIMFKEMMPNLLPYLAASFTGNVSGAILAATGLEALGLGPTRIPTLGMTIFYSIRAAAILRGMWWWWGIPIAVLVIIFTGLFLMTVGLDEIANPRLRGARAQ